MANDITWFGDYASWMPRGPTRIAPRKPRRAFIRERREAAGLTQEDLAYKLKTTKGTISRWENGARDPGSMAIEAIAEVLEIEPAKMYERPRPDSIDDRIANHPDLKPEIERFLDYLITRTKKS
jgi:transcriptional regulator with XRE-family HTH domain